MCQNTSCSNSSVAPRKQSACLGLNPSPTYYKSFLSTCSNLKTDHRTPSSQHPDNDGMGLFSDFIFVFSIILNIADTTALSHTWYSPHPPSGGCHFLTLHQQGRQDLGFGNHGWDWNLMEWHCLAGPVGGGHADLTKALSSCHWCSSRHWEEPCSRACCSRNSWRRLFFPESLMWVSVVMALPRRASLRRAERSRRSCPCRMHHVDLWGKWARGWESMLLASPNVMVTFICQPECSQDAQIADQILFWVLLDEINVWVSRWSKPDCTS